MKLSKSNFKIVLFVLIIIGRKQNWLYASGREKAKKKKKQQSGFLTSR